MSLPARPTRLLIDGWEVEVGDFTLTYTIPGNPPPPPPLRLRHLPSATATASASATASAASAAASASASATSAAATAAAAAAASATSTATATSTAATSTSTTSAGPLPRAAFDRAQAHRREAADPQGALPCRHRASRPDQANAPRPRRRPDPEGGSRQASSASRSTCGLAAGNHR